MPCWLKHFLYGTLVISCLVGGLFGFKAFWKYYSLRIQCQGIFDKTYYVDTYPDVKNSGLSPFAHYMTQGYKELRNPAPYFDAQFYYALYHGDPKKIEGVKITNMLKEYLRIGQNYRRLTHPSALKKVPNLKNPQYYLCVAAIFRDDERFLKEWIEYYLMMGVEHFYLVNHCSKDNSDEVLKPYVDRGLVTLFHDKRLPRPGVMTLVLSTNKTLMTAQYMLYVERQSGC